MVLGEGMALLCRECLAAGNLPTTLGEWRRLRHRREVEALGWTLTDDAYPGALPSFGPGCPIEFDPSSGKRTRRGRSSADAHDEVDIRPLLPDVQDDMIIDLASLILTELLRSSATEVRVERNETRVQVLYRLDGLLNAAMQPPVHLGRRIVACFRLLAGVGVPRRARVQEKGIVLTTARRRKLRLHLAFVPHASGENVVVTRKKR
jgi:hypothetical protein